MFIRPVRQFLLHACPLRKLAVAVLALLASSLNGCGAPPSGYDNRSAAFTMSAAPQTSDATRSEVAADASTERAIQSPKSTSPVGASDHDESIRRQTAEELGPDVAAAMPPLPATTPREPADPGAKILVQSIADALEVDSAATGSATVVVSVHELRNLSRASHAEFAEFLQRFASLLNIAGAEHGLAFASDSQLKSDYRMLGSAYMITAAGFDQWELFLSISPTSRQFTVWDARSPIRVLRTVRPGQPQIISIGR